MKKTFLLLCLFLTVSVSFSFSQTGIITGVITDSLTGHPVVNLTVFIPSTTVGTTTNQKGEYLLEKLNPGDYILMFRHLLYPSTSRFVTIEPGKKIMLDLVIAENSRMIKEVVVVGKLPDRRMATFLFNKYFLGDENGTYCKLENPAVLSFYSDGNTLKATAKEPLKITNRHLGYNITFYLDYFQCIDNRNSEFNYDDISNFGYSGYALFEDLTAAVPIRAIGWKFNRNSEFKGSLRHFLACLYRNELNNNHYFMRRAYHGLNEIQLVEKQSNAMTKIHMAEMDSLSSWNHLTGKSYVLFYDPNERYEFSRIEFSDGTEPGLKFLSADALILVFRDFRKSDDLSDDFISTLKIPKEGITFDKDGNFWVHNGELKWINLDNTMQIKRLLPFDYMTKINETKN
ncbi:MAG: carboxypeptidase-like regulatory domain-containing protein [Bacteroidales bacterium]|jgi:hypothetical protein